MSDQANNDTTPETPTNEVETTTDAAVESNDTPEIDPVDAVMDEILDGDTDFEDEEPVAPKADKKGKEAEAKSDDAKDGETKDGEDSTDADWAAATSALISMGMSADEIAAMPKDLVLKMGARLAADAGQSSAGSDDPEAEAESEDSADKQPKAKPEAKKPAVEADAESVDLDSIGEEIVASLIEDGGFDETESKAISGAVTKAIGKIQGSLGSGFDADRFANIERTVQAMEAIQTRRMIDDESSRLADIYPEIDAEGGREKLEAKAGELYQQGVKFKDVGELVRAAALTLWGANRTAEIKEATKKVNKLKANGTTSSGKPVSQDDGPKDAFDAAFDEAYEASR
jgi:hypothetical protein